MIISSRLASAEGGLLIIRLAICLISHAGTDEFPPPFQIGIHAALTRVSEVIAWLTRSLDTGSWAALLPQVGASHPAPPNSSFGPTTFMLPVLWIALYCQSIYNEIGH